MGFFRLRAMNGNEAFPLTEAEVSRIIDLSDTGAYDDPKDVEFHDLAGEIAGDGVPKSYQIEIGERECAEPDARGEVPFVFASAPITAGGQQVGTVYYTDH